MLELASHKLDVVAKHLVGLGRQAREEHGLETRGFDALDAGAAEPASLAADVDDVESAVAAFEAVADDWSCWHFLFFCLPPFALNGDDEGGPQGNYVLFRPRRGGGCSWVSLGFLGFPWVLLLKRCWLAGEDALVTMTNALELAKPKPIRRTRKKISSACHYQGGLIST